MNKVPCPLSSRCPDSGWHIAGSATLAEHQARATGGASGAMPASSSAPRPLGANSEMKIYETPLSELDDENDVYGDDLGYENDLMVTVHPVHDDESRSAIATIVSYEDHLERHRVEEAIEKGLIEVTNDDPDDDPEEAQFWLTDKGRNAAANVIAEEYVRVGGDPKMADKIYVENNDNPDLAHISAGIDFPKEAQDMPIGEASEKYLEALYAALANVTDSGTFGSRYVYSAICESEYQTKRENQF